MKNWMVFGLLLVLGGCTSLACDQPLSGSRCRDEQLLYQNDMLQAKILIASGQLEDYELASALLKRSAALDDKGEVEFYQAALLIREGPQAAEVLALLERSAKHDHPYAIALLYKIHAEPYLIDTRDPLKAEQYRAAYAELDVAKSGYPSFEKALSVVTQLVDPAQVQNAPPAEE